MSAALTLRERFGSWIAGRAATAPMEFRSMTPLFHGAGISNQPDIETLLQESLGIADRAMRALADRVATLNPLVKVSRPDGMGTQVDEILDDHALKALLDRPHPNFTRSQLMRLTTQHLGTAGRAAWLKVGSRLGLPVELHPIPPARIWPVVRSGVIDGYQVQTADGQMSLHEPDVIVYFWLPDPEDPWGPEGYLGPAGVTADSKKFAGQHMRSHYQNDATPKTVLEPGEGAVDFDPAERKRFWAEWRHRYHARSGSEQGGPAILPTHYKLIQLAMQSGADVVPLLEHWQDELLMTYGVPKSVLGKVVSGDRSSAETNQYVMDLHSVTPLATAIAEAITLQLAPDFDPSIFVEFEDFVASDKMHTLQKQAQDLTLKVRSVNQVREDDGLDPVDWGEQPIGSFADTPYDPDAVEPEPEPELPADLEMVDEDEEEERTRAARAAPVMAEWQRQVQREKRWVPLLLRQVRKVLKRERDKVIERLDATRQRALSIEDLIQPDDWEDLFALQIEPIRVAAFQEIAIETLGTLGFPEEFVFTDAMRNTLRRQGADLVQRVYMTTRKDISRVLDEGTALGEGIDQLASRINGVFREASKHRARTIARTEVHKASQAAQLESFELAGVEYKRWNTQRDGVVRDSHSYAEGQIRATGQPFDLAGEPADAPGIGAGGTSLSAANTINCRCFLSEAEGPEG